MNLKAYKNQRKELTVRVEGCFVLEIKEASRVYRRLITITITFEESQNSKNVMFNAATDIIKYLISAVNSHKYLVWIYENLQSVTTSPIHEKLFRRQTNFVIAEIITLVAVKVVPY